MVLSHYVFTGGLWCTVLDLGVSPFDPTWNYGYMATTNRGLTHVDNDLDELLDTVQFFGDTETVYFLTDDER